MKHDIKEVIEKFEDDKKLQISLTVKESTVKELKKIARSFPIPLSQLVDHILWIFLIEF